MALAFYIFTIPLPNNFYLDESLRLRIYNFRPYVLVAILACCSWSVSPP